MNQNKFIHPLDLEFQGIKGVIASYLIPHQNGAVLIESGPGSTQENLVKGLRNYGYSPFDITDVFLTHIHLDHAGAAGWLANHGAQIHVHPFGAPHLSDPVKLLSSAQRIYGDKMDTLWGEFLPVPIEKISILEDKVPVFIGENEILPINTPGHANHHMVFVFQRICFSGDLGGVRLYQHNAIRVPMPPPDFHLGKWRTSLAKLKSHTFDYIAPTHFGIYSNPKWHLDKLSTQLDAVEAWINSYLQSFATIEDLRSQFSQWVDRLDVKDHLSPEMIHAYELANPKFMSADGILRYWNKYCQS